MMNPARLLLAILERNNDFTDEALEKIIKTYHKHQSEHESDIDIFTDEYDVRQNLLPLLKLAIEVIETQQLFIVEIQKSISEDEKWS